MGTTRGKRTLEPPSGPVSLKTLAAYLGLDPTTVSVVLNEVPGRSIPEATRERIRKAALKFNYHPSFLARSLRNRRTMTIGILVPVLADGYHAEVMTGIGDSLLEEKYFYFIAHHRHIVFQVRVKIINIKEHLEYLPAHRRVILHASKTVTQSLDAVFNYII